MTPTDSTPAAPDAAGHPAPPFSAAVRREAWSELGREPFDLLVVGGGITGAGAALDAAGRGLSVALVEAGDLGGGTSSRSSRLVHGGLRYLETLDFPLVFEALAERARLMRLAPHLVHPLAFLFPVFRGGPVGRLKLAAGMWLYDALALFRSIRLHRMLDAGGALRREPGLRREGLQGGALYYDAQVDDARLTLAIARAAHDAGACIVPRARVVGVLEDDGRIVGARVRDELGGGEAMVRARLVLNATGPWCDEIRRLADPDARPRLRPTKGVHVAVPAARMGNTGAVIFQSAVDGRVMFVLPWGALSYVGTTDTDLAGRVEDAGMDERDVAYLLDSANALFPAARLGLADVVSTWTGVRPLVAPASYERGISAGETSREHEIWRDPNGLLNIAGGKLTTYRVMAEQAARAAAAVLLREHGVESGDFFTAEVPLPGAPDVEWGRFQRDHAARAAALGVASASAERLARAYGVEADLLLEAIRRDPALGEPILPPHPYLWAEVDHCVEHEMALTLTDLLRRRMQLFYETPDGGAAVARAVARRMGAHPALGWPEDEIDRQVARYLEKVAATRLRPATPTA